MISAIDHIAYRVTSLDEISNLMQQLGYVELRRTTHHGGAVEMESAKQPGLILEFTLTGEGEASGLDHICFKLEQEENFNELMESRFPLDSKPRLSPGSGRLIANFKDADGSKWQLTL